MCFYLILKSLCQDINNCGKVFICFLLMILEKKVIFIVQKCMQNTFFNHN